MNNRLLFSAFVVFLVAAAAYGEDSPQFRGARRDGVFREQGLLKSWPENGPPVAWVAYGIGKGYSSVSVVAGKIYVTGMMEKGKGVFCVLDLEGNIARKIPYGEETIQDRAPGPRSTPTIEGDRAYFLSGLGVLTCIDLAKDAVLWQVNILERFHAENISWHLAESLLIDGDRVICTPGGPDTTVAALNKTTGETVWTSKSIGDKTSYCTPIVVTHNGRRILLTATAKFILGLDADSGNLLWTHEQKAPWGIHAVTPIYRDGLVYFTAGDGLGGGALEIAPDGASVSLKWEDNTLDNLHHGVVDLEGYLYGTGSKSRQLVCLEMATGKVMWQTKEIGEGVTIAADGMLYIYEGPKKGIVSLVKAMPTGFERTGSFIVEEGEDNHWAHPTIANGRLYVRHGDALIAYDIADKK